MNTSHGQRRNLRTLLILAALAAAFFVAIIVKVGVFGQ